MGRTPIPLRIMAQEKWLVHPQIVALVEQGHIVTGLSAYSLDGADVDLIIHENAHGWSDAMFEHEAYLANALKAARKRKKEK